MIITNSFSPIQKIKNLKLFILLGVIYVSLSFNATAQGNLISKNKTPEISIINEDAELSPSIIEGFKKIIKKVYPKLAKDFNKNARMDITVKIDTAYDGVAYAHDGRVTVSSKWLHSKPNDLDLMTHEIMHIIQSYPNGAGPGWLTEGIADFVRYKYGLDNEKAGWSLTEFSDKQNYTNSYRITARFLEWVSQNYDKQIVYKLDKKLRSNIYSPELWKEYTGFTIDQLWMKYSENPSLK
tara:strand:- start:9440 stop:10156 length:717 start_codon:yes stop_codon:yes gene_type:complete